MQKNIFVLTYTGWTIRLEPRNSPEQAFFMGYKLYDIITQKTLSVIGRAVVGTLVTESRGSLVDARRWPADVSGYGHHGVTVTSQSKLPLATFHYTENSSC